MKRVLNNEKGTTLLELVVSLSIVLIIAVGVSGMIFNAINYQLLTEKKQNATKLGQMILEEFSAINEFSSSNIQLLTLGELERKLNTEEFIYQGSYDNYQVTLKLDKGLSFENEQSNITFALKDNKLYMGQEYHSLESGSEKIVITKIEDSQYEIKIGNLSKIGDSSSIIINVLDNQFEGTLSVENSVDNEGNQPWITVDVKYADDSFENLKLETGPKIRVRQMYSNQQSSNKLENFYHVTLTVSLDNQELFETYSNKFLILREEG